MSQPIQYQRGWTEFYKLRFKVTPDVLIPRPETELLVDEVIRFLKEIAAVRQNEPRNDTSTTLSTGVIASVAKQSLTILDLGTGSGCIAISLAKQLNRLPTFHVGTQIIATDISQKALKVAQQNAKLHGVEDKITFVKSNLLSAFCHSGGRMPMSTAPANAVESKNRDAIAEFTLSGVEVLQHDNPNIIVTNLPYIPSERIPYLDSSVKDFEPCLALDGGEDGFKLYRKLFRQITEFSLPPQGWKPKLIVGEIDYTHGELAAIEAQKYFPQAQIEIKTDLAHKQRILLIKQPHYETLGNLAP